MQHFDVGGTEANLQDILECYLNILSNPNTTTTDADNLELDVCHSVVRSVERRIKGLILHRNQKVPINRLPNELLAVILSNALPSMHRRYSRPGVSTPVNETDVLDYYHVLGQLRGVCRRWLHLVDGTPPLWALLFLGDRPLPALDGPVLGKSGDALLDIILGLDSSPRDVLPTIEHVLSRCQALSSPVSRNSVLAVRGGLRIAASSLKSVEVGVPFGDTLLPMSRLFPRQTPHVVDISLTRFSEVREDPWLSGLRNLSLHTVETTVDALTGILSSCPKLESLSLTNVAPTDLNGKTLSEFCPLDPPRRINLPCLSSLRLFSNRPFAAALLQDLSAPACTFIEMGPEILPYTTQSDSMDWQSFAANPYVASYISSFLHRCPSPPSDATASLTPTVFSLSGEGFSFTYSNFSYRAIPRFYISVVEALPRRLGRTVADIRVDPGVRGGIALAKVFNDVFPNARRLTVPVTWGALNDGFPQLSWYKYMPKLSVVTVLGVSHSHSDEGTVGSDRILANTLQTLRRLLNVARFRNRRQATGDGGWLYAPAWTDGSLSLLDTVVFRPRFQDSRKGKMLAKTLNSWLPGGLLSVPDGV